jgi:hypothetical protein
MPRAPYGARQPPVGKEGMAMSMYIHVSELKMLDELRSVWGLKRNAALRRLIVEGYQREVVTDG